MCRARHCVAHTVAAPLHVLQVCYVPQGATSPFPCINGAAVDTPVTLMPLDAATETEVVQQDLQVADRKMMLP